MATNVILPALGMAQDTGKIIQWLKAEGERVTKGEPLAEIETDKATVEIEASADGVLACVAAAAGDDVPVGHVIAVILAPEDVLTDNEKQTNAQPHVLDSAQEAVSKLESVISPRAVPTPQNRSKPELPTEVISQYAISASPLASRIAAEHNLDLSQVKPVGKRIQKADVLTHLQNQKNAGAVKTTARLTMASPKARHLAAQQGKELTSIKGTGPEGAVLVADVLKAIAPVEVVEATPVVEKTTATSSGSDELALSNVWRIMAERTTQSWTSVPHFYLVREVNVSRLIAWREQMLKRSTEKITYTDLLVKIVAAALQMHPRLNTSWNEGKLMQKQGIHVGLAVAVEEGLVVPVIHQADTLSLNEIAQQRKELVAKAQSGKLRLQDISDGSFTISNLGMYNVDAFNAIINQPQAAILAVGRIAERVVPINGLPAVQPMMVLTLSCDHRAVDGARGAQFLATLVELIEEPLELLS